MAHAPQTIAANPFYKGVTALEAARLFDMPTSTVKDNLVGTIPSGKRGNVDVYLVKDVALALTPSQVDDEVIRKILKMNHTSLPVQLSKEFWAAETSRQKFLVADGELWPTTKVVEWLGDTFKQLRLSLMLMADSVDREESLSNKQRETLVALIDATLNDAADRLVNEFSDREGGRDSTSYEEIAPDQGDEGQEL